MTSFSTLQMISYNFNPYVSDSSSQRIRSKVVSLVLKDDTGKAFNTIDLPSDIEIDIPVSKYYLEDRTRSNHFLNPRRMQYHVITVREENTTMKITIKTKATASIMVYVKFAEQPTETSYDEKRLNSRNNECNFRGICSHSIVIKCRYSGKYYVGLWKNSESPTELSKSRGRRSILPKQATREKCVRFKNPPPTFAPQVEYVSFVPQYDSERSVNYSLQVETIWCAFWSDNEQRWTSKGCKVRKIQRKHRMSHSLTKETMKCIPDRVTEVFKILIFSYWNVLEKERRGLKNLMYSVCQQQRF